MDDPAGTNLQHRMERNRELGLFLLLAVVLFPVLSILIVSGYGFLVWMSQLVFGPPTG